MRFLKRRSARTTRAVSRKSQDTGKLLRQARRKTKLEIADLTKSTGLSEEFITSLETGDFSSMTHDVYSLGRVAKYAAALGVDQEKIKRRYLAERGQLPEVMSLRRKHQYRSPIVTSSLVLRVFIVATALAILGYLIYQVVIATGSPRLNVVFPGENQVVYTDEVELVGTASPGSTVTVDGRQITIAEDGSFRYLLILPEGTHTLLIGAENELGRTSHVERTFAVRYGD